MVERGVSRLDHAVFAGETDAVHTKLVIMQAR